MSEVQSPVREPLLPGSKNENFLALSTVLPVRSFLKNLSLKKHLTLSKFLKFMEKMPKEFDELPFAFSINNLQKLCRTV